MAVMEVGHADLRYWDCRVLRQSVIVDGGSYLELMNDVKWQKMIDNHSVVDLIGFQD